MKRRVFIFLTFITMALSGIPAWGQDKAAPEIFFKETTFTVDEVIEGTLIEHTFSVFNRGNALLEIRKVNPG